MAVLRLRAVLAGVLVLSFVCGPMAVLAPADPATPPPPAEQVRPLVRDLSNEDWKVRDRAQEQLTAMGGAAEGPLRERLKHSKLDPEERSRIENVLKKIEEARKSGPAVVDLRRAGASPREVLAAITEQTKVSFAPGHRQPPHRR
jgi:hypothetical protein